MAADRVEENETEGMPSELFQYMAKVAWVAVTNNSGSDHGGNNKWVHERARTNFERFVDSVGIAPERFTLVGRNQVPSALFPTFGDIEIEAPLSRTWGHAERDGEHQSYSSSFSVALYNTLNAPNAAMFLNGLEAIGNFPRLAAFCKTVEKDILVVIRLQRNGQGSIVVDLPADLAGKDADGREIV